MKSQQCQNRFVPRLDTLEARYAPTVQIELAGQSVNLFVEGDEAAFIDITDYGHTVEVKWEQDEEKGEKKGGFEAVTTKIEEINVFGGKGNDVVL